MSPAALAARIRPLVERGSAFLRPVAPLLARLCFGQAFVLAGWGKLNNLEKTTGFFESLGIPLASVQAPMIALLEFVGGILLLLGLGTRTVALLLSGTMVVAILTAHGTELLATLPFRDDVTGVKPVPFLVTLCWLMAHGGGRFSVDGWRQRRAARAAPPAVA